MGRIRITKLVDDPLMLFRFKPGKTWATVIDEFCKKHRNVSGQLDNYCPFDLEVTFLSNKKRYLFELKANDLLSSLHARNTTTSLERELKGDPANPDYKGYLQEKCDGVFLIYIQNGYSIKEQIFLDRFMFNYPTVRRKSYLTQENAIAGIYRLMSKGIKPLNMDKPAYVTWKLGNPLANMLAVGVDGISPDNAVAVSQLFYGKIGILMEDLWEKGMKFFVAKLRTVYQDLVDGSTHHMVHKIYDFFMDTTISMQLSNNQLHEMDESKPYQIEPVKPKEKKEINWSM